MAKKTSGGKLTSSAYGSSRAVPFTIDDSTPDGKIYSPVIDGQVMTHGYVPRDRAVYPPQMFRSPPASMPLIPESEWDARFEEQEKQQSSLEHVFNRLAATKGVSVPFLHQNGHGYCWGYSTGNATMLDRAARNQSYVRLNPHAVCAIIKGGADQGGWCGLSAKFLTEVGIPTEAFWKVHSRDLKQDNAAMRANAAQHKLQEDWIDLTASIYDRNLTRQQLATCLLSNIPCAIDFNEWGHSVCAGRWYRVEKGVWVPRILNSWLGWGDAGWGSINRRWTVDSAVALRVTGISVA
jgi:hypothetical protein